MTSEQLKMFLDMAYGFDIGARNRKRAMVYAKKVHCKLCVDYGIGLTEAGAPINLAHDNVIYHNKTFDVVRPLDLHNYNAAIDYFNIPLRKIVSMDELTPKPELTELMRKLNCLSRKDFKYFMENKVTPFFRSLNMEREINKIGQDNRA